MHFVVATDTSGNLPTKTANDYDLKVIPFAYFVEGDRRTCLDTDAFDGDAFYALLKNTAVTTTQINPIEYADFFEPFLKEGKDVIYVSMSSGISGSCQSATIGAQMLAEQYPDRVIEIVDTRGASLGEGLIAVQAAKLRDADVETREAAKRLRDASERMFNVLGIKPILKGGEDGQISAFAVVHSRKRSVKALAAQYEKHVVDPENQTIGIAHAACREDAELLIKLIKESPKAPKDILLVDYEPVTGSHVGPGALALFFESYAGIRAIKGLDWQPAAKTESTPHLRPISAPHGV